MIDKRDYSTETEVGDYVGVGKRKLINANLELRAENEHLLTLRYEVMADNRRLEVELTTVREQAEMQIDALKDDLFKAQREIREHRWHVSQIMKRESALNRELEKTTRERDVAQVWARRMKRERDEARRWARYYKGEYEYMSAYADKLADGLPMLPKDLENLRKSNAYFAQLVFELEAEVKRLKGGAK